MNEDKSVPELEAYVSYLGKSDSEFIVDIEGILLSQDQKIGEFTLHYLDLDPYLVANNMEEIDRLIYYDAFDSHSHDVMKVYEGLINDEADGFRSEILKKVGENLTKVLYVSEMRIEPDRTSKKIEQDSLRKIMFLCRGLIPDIIVIEAVPDQSAKSKIRVINEVTFASIAEKLKDQWKEIGFHNISGGNYLFIEGASDW